MDSNLHHEVPGTKITPSSPTRPGPPASYSAQGEGSPSIANSISPSASMKSMNSGLASAPWAAGSGGVTGSGLSSDSIGGSVGGISGLPGDRRTIGHGVPAPKGPPVDSTRYSYQEQEVLRDGSGSGVQDPGARTSSIGAVDSHSHSPNASLGKTDEIHGSAFGGRAYGSNSPASASTETFGIPGGLEQAHTKEHPPLPQHGASVGHAGGILSTGSNPYDVDLVIPYDISGEKSEAPEIERGYRRLTDALQSAGLRIASRPAKGKGKGQEEVWVFVGASDAKIKELVEREQ